MNAEEKKGEPIGCLPRSFFAYRRHFLRSQALDIERKVFEREANGSPTSSPPQPSIVVLTQKTRHILCHLH